MNRARFALSQYRWTLLHVNSIWPKEKDRVCSEVKEELLYASELIKNATDISPNLMEIYHDLQDLIKDDFTNPHESITRSVGMAMIPDDDSDYEE
jgi:hypothetical protein